MTLDPAALGDVLDDPAFKHRLARGKLDVAAIRRALLDAKAARFAAILDGRGRDETRVQLETLKRARSRATRAKVARLFRALLAIRAGDDRQNHELAGITWQHAKDLLLALLDDFPELALELPAEHRTGRDPRAVPVPMVLTRRQARDPLAEIKKRTRAALKAAGLPDFLAGRALRAAGL